MKIQIVIGSTRPGRVGKQVGDWAYKVASERKDVEFELVDIADYNLPPLDEPVPASAANYSMDHTKKWSSKIAEADGYIFVTPEYNHGVPGVFKNAVDYLYKEWNDKSLGFVSYGVAGGVRSVEQWRGIAAQLRLADVREEVSLYLSRDFKDYSVFQPTPEHETQLNKVIDQVASWGTALKGVRA